MLYRETIAVCSHIHTKHKNRVCGQNVELLNVSPSSTYSNHWAVNGLQQFQSYDAQHLRITDHRFPIATLTAAILLTPYRCACVTDTLFHWQQLSVLSLGVRCSVRERGLSVLKTLHTGSLANSAFWSTGTRFLLPGWSVESEAGHSPPF